MFEMSKNNNKIGISIYVISFWHLMLILVEIFDFIL